MANYREGFKVILIQKQIQYDISSIVQGFSLKSDLNTLGQTVEFTLPQSDNQKYFPRLKIKEGQVIVVFVKQKEIYRGLIVSLDQSAASISISSVDYSFYLKNNSPVLQFKNISVAEAIEQSCRRFGIPVWEISPMSTKVREIYTDKALSDIFKELIEKHQKASGQKMRMEMYRGKLHIFRLKSLKVSPQFKPSRVEASVDIIKHMSQQWQYGTDIEDLANQITVIDEEGKVLGLYQSKESIEKYGLLANTLKVSKEEKAHFEKLGRQLLKEKNRVNENFSIKVIGDDCLLAGRMLTMPADFPGEWIIESATHHYENGIHLCDLKLGRDQQ